MENNRYKFYPKMLLGTGSFSKVYLGYDLIYHKTVAVKEIILDRCELLPRIEIEVQLMRRMDHPNIVSFYDLFKGKNEWYLIMEYCDAGTLADVIHYHRRCLIQKGVPILETNARYYLGQLRDALHYLWDLGYIHRDLKPSNILLTRNHMGNSLVESEVLFGEPQQSGQNITIADLPEDYHASQGLIVKLADFGLVRFNGENPDTIMNGTICGSPLYMAPELLLENHSDSRSDLWSFGIIMYELLFGGHPLQAPNMRELRKRLGTGIQIPSQISPTARDLLSRLLRTEHNARISWDHFWNHPWFLENTMDVPQKLKDIQQPLERTTSDPLYPPVESRQLPVESRQLPVESRQLPVESRQLPVESRQLPVESRQLPVESRQLPVESRQLPVESRQLPVESRQFPVESRQSPKNPPERTVEQTVLVSSSYPVQILGRSNLSRMKTSYIQNLSGPKSYPPFHQRL
jgi:serine/threonine protein kinase